MTTTTKYGIQWRVANSSRRNLDIPNNSGVYIIEQFNEIPRRWFMVYVGESKFLRQRLINHPIYCHIKKSSPIGTKLRFLSHECDWTEMYELEKAFIRKFSPKFNFSGTRNATELGIQIKKALDGRTKRWLCLQVKLHENELGKKIAGFKAFTQKEIDSINKLLNSDIKV